MPYKEHHDEMIINTQMVTKTKKWSKRQKKKIISAEIVF